MKNGLTSPSELNELNSGEISGNALFFDLLTLVKDSPSFINQIPSLRYGQQVIYNYVMALVGYQVQGYQLQHPPIGLYANLD